LPTPDWSGDRKTAQIEAIQMKSFNLPATAPLQRGFLLCAEYERQLAGGSPLSSLMGRRISEAQGRHREMGSEESVEQSRGSMDKNRISTGDWPPVGRVVRASIGSASVQRHENQLAFIANDVCRIMVVLVVCLQRIEVHRLHLFTGGHHAWGNSSNKSMRP
jgi:hypothetical protein